MSEFGVSLTNMAMEKPWLYLITLAVFLAAIILIGLFVLKIIKYFGDKKGKKKVKLPGGVEIEQSDSDEIPVATECTSKIYDNLSNLANLIIDFPEAGRKYETTISTLKQQLIDDQFKDFTTELKKYRINIKKYYSEKLKIDESDDKIRLFSYWFKQVIKDDVEPQINSILFRNGLNEKTAEQLEDVLRKLYEETFSSICDSIDEAPPYISKIAHLKEIIVSTKNEYRQSLDTGLNNAKRRRLEKESFFEKARKEYVDERMEILNRDLPKEVVEKIKENVK
jgi:hypothetical protein